MTDDNEPPIVAPGENPGTGGTMTGPTTIPEQGTIVGALTDGTGISAFTASKTIKDFVADVLLSGAAALAAANIMGVGDALTSPNIAAFAVAGAVIRAAYRAVLRWATTD